MKAWLLLAAAFLLWPGCSSQNACDEPDEIDFGEIVSAEKAKYLEDDRVQYRCNPSYVLEGPEWIQCKGQEWTPHPPKCLEITCNSPSILHGSYRPQRTIYHDGDLIRIQCDSGFTFEPDNGEKVVECTKNGWSPSPKCVNVRCSSPHRIQNGRIISEIKASYFPQEKVHYRCNTGYALLGSTFITCSKNGWTETPRCSDLQTKCGRPPYVENGDIVDLLKQFYLHSESVIYQCQNFYAMQGVPMVTCQNGHWSQPPTCRVACTASEDDMREHNIRLKWNPRDKIYSEAGNSVEFECLRGYKLHPYSGPLRINCVDGKFDYPDCIPI